MSREKSQRNSYISDRDGRDDRRGGAEDLNPGMDVDSDDGRRSPRSRRYPDKFDRRRERDYGGSNRDRGRGRERDRGSDRGHERDRDRDRDWEKERDRGERGREGDRERNRKRERERDSRRSRSPRHDQRVTSDDYDSRKEPRIQGRGRDSSVDHDKSHKRGVDRVDEEIMATEGQRAAIVAEFVDGIAREHDQHVDATTHSLPAVLAPGPPAVAQADEEEIMKKLGIPVGFSTTKGKYVSDANHSAVKLTTKRTPRQYMNRRGGFNRPLPAEANR